MRKESYSNCTLEDYVKSLFEFKIPLNQVLISLKILTADDLFSKEASMLIPRLSYSKVVFVERNKDLFEQQSEIEAGLFKELDELQINFIAAQYLSIYTDKPSKGAILLFCPFYAFLEYLKALEKFNTVRREKKDMITLLLNDLSGNAWAIAFESFMKNQGVSVDLKIYYPIFIQELIKKMDEKEFQAIIDPANHLKSLNIMNGLFYDPSKLFDPTGDKFHDYMVVRMQESYTQSFLSIRKPHVPKS